MLHPITISHYFQKMNLRARRSPMDSERFVLWIQIRIIDSVVMPGYSPQQGCPSKHYGN